MTAFVLAAALSGSFVAQNGPERAQERVDYVAVVADLHGGVRIHPPTGDGPHDARLGMKLSVGEVVETDKDASATIFLAGGQLIEVMAASRIRVTRDLAADSSGSPRRLNRLSSSTLEVLERGVWVLGDPKGSVLVGALRGAPSSAPIGNVPVEALSPRNETVFFPTSFYWEGGEGAVRVVVARGEDVVWRGPEVAASSGILQPADQRLEAGVDYTWWVESVSTGERLSGSAGFRTGRQSEEAARTEIEAVVSGLEASGTESSLAAFLACSFYREAGAWSRAIAASGGLRGDEMLAAKTRELARLKMGLTVHGAERLRSLLTEGQSPSTRRR